MIKEAVKFCSFDGFFLLVLDKVMYCTVQYSSPDCTVHLSQHRSHSFNQAIDDKNTLNLDQARYPQLFFFRNLVE